MVSSRVIDSKGLRMSISYDIFSNENDNFNDKDVGRCLFRMSLDVQMTTNFELE